jgi:hypothetical protein
MSAPAGMHDYSRIRLTHHALERFRERFWTGPPGSREAIEAALRQALSRTRRLGRNAANGAIATVALLGDRMMVAILQDDACVTVLTWPQFEPNLVDFGRPKLPRKRGRWMRRLREPPAAAAEGPADPDTLGLESA